MRSVPKSEDNLLLKLDFNNLKLFPYLIKEIGEYRTVGVNFETNKPLTIKRVDSSPIHSVHVYNLDFDFQGIRELEKFDNRMPTLIDFPEIK